MVEPNKEALADETVPRIKLAGKEWPIPELALEQNIQVFQPLMRRLGTLNALRGVLRDGGALISAITPEALTDFATVVYWGLARAHRTPDGKAPAMTRAEFDAMPISVLDVVQASPTIGRQAGLLKAVKATDEVAPPLEPAATTSPTG